MLSTLLALTIAATPKVGDVAPDFKVRDVDGNELQLEQLVKKHVVILAFFPKAFTPGWTKELTAYRDRYADIEKAGARVLAVSTDDAKTLKSFRESLKSKDTFVSDSDATLAKLYDVKTPLIKIASRTTFVIGPDRKILSVVTGSDAIEVDNSIRACTFPRRSGSADAGTKP
jgi:thioredoxin-dependent peroxiredoxin